MKKVVCAIALLFMTGIANAQFQFTPHAGVSIYKESGAQSAGIGAQVGVDVRYSFNGQDKGWALQSGLYYQQRMIHYSGGLYYNYESATSGSMYGWPVFYPFEAPMNGTSFIALPEDAVVTDIIHANGKLRSDYLQLPIMAQYAWKFGSDIRLHVSAGGYFGYEFTGRRKSYYIYLDPENLTQCEYQYYNYRSNWHDWDMGFISQVGLEVKRFAFLVNYQTNLYHRNQNGAHNLASFSIGYTF